MPAEPKSSGLPERFVVPHQWLEAGWAMLDEASCVLQSNEALRHWLGNTEDGLRGTPFWPAIWSRVPQWKKPISDLLQQPSAFAKLELDASAGDERQWFCLEIARHEAVCFVRLNSTLAPPAQLAESSLEDHFRTDAARRLLYSRLIRAEAQVDNLVNHWPGIVFSQRADLSFHFVSPKIEMLTGIAASEWRRQPQLLWRVVHEGDTKELEQQLRRAGQAHEGVTSTYRIRHAHTGRVTYVLEYRQALRAANGLILGYEGVWLDVTRQTIAETRLSSAAWKETLALLTMGLAHDFSNIIAGIHSLSEVFQSQVGQDHPFQEGLTLIQRNAMQASQLVHRILNLHHGRVGERNYHDLNELVTDMKDLARKIVPRRIELETALATQPLPLYVDAVEFRQVFINLIINAVDAMPQGGKLRLEASRCEAYPPMQFVQGELPSVPAICLMIQDNGSGIPARNVPNIFDPFFTTKPLNKGSGLGLYNARLFTEKHHGAVSVDSTPKAGTTFRVWLPQADFTEAEREQSHATSARRTLLVIGQPGPALEGVVEFLRQNGYYVVMAYSEDSAHEMLLSPDYLFSGVMLLAAAEPVLSSTLFREIERYRMPVKIILQIVGSNQDELDTQILKRLDLLIPPDLGAHEILAKLNAIFQDTRKAP